MTYSYDRYGNRYQYQSQNQSSLPYIPVEDNQITKATNRFTAASGITYDDAGNITVDQKFRGQQYQYDANQRMKRVANLYNQEIGTAVYLNIVDDYTRASAWLSKSTRVCQGRAWYECWTDSRL